MKNKQLLIVLFCIIPPIKAKAQVDSIKIITGEILNLRMEKIPFVNIKISSNSSIFISNSEGKFQLKAFNTDTLVFSTIGYQMVKIQVKNLRTDYNYITLLDEVYQLNTIDISAMRWQDFKFEMMNKELKPEEQKILWIKGFKDPYAKQKPSKLISGPIGVIYKLVNKECIRNRKLKRWGKTYDKSYIKVE
jgi:hypothetical protein